MVLNFVQGLDIATNKVTTEEMKGIPHHLMSFLSPSVTDYNVRRYRDQVLPLLDDLWSRGKLPVIVGGTTYYIEAVLYKVLIDDSPPSELASMSDDQSQGWWCSV
jgi:tRNA dimethylallyltransferase